MFDAAGRPMGGGFFIGCWLGWLRLLLFGFLLLEGGRFPRADRRLPPSRIRFIWRMELRRRER